MMSPSGTLMVKGSRIRFVIQALFSRSQPATTSCPVSKLVDD